MTAIPHSAPRAEFSVVIPLFNKRRFIGRTIESVRSQSLSPREVIIVDDGSTDGSLEFVSAIDDERITIIQQPNAGPGPARNRGVASAQADWVAFIDADDLWHPLHLETLANVVAACPEAELVSSGTRWQAAHLADTSLPEGVDPMPRYLNYFRDCGERRVHTSSVAIRRSTITDTGGFKAFIPGEDTEYWARLALHHRFAVSALPTSTYIRENDGIMDRQRPGSDDDELPGSRATLTMVAAALKDDALRDRHADIIEFCNRLMLQSAKNNLYHGRGAAARRCLRSLRGRPGIVAIGYRLLSFFPGRPLAAVSRAYTRAKKRVSR